MTAKIVILVVYLAGLAAIGVVASRRVQTIGDFFVGGKKLGYWFVSFSSRATGESGWLLLGFTGMGYAIGVSALWVVLGEMFGVAFAWVFLTQRFKKLTDRYDSITIPDYLESRFGDVGHALRAVSALVLVVFVTAYVSAQFTAAGKAFHGFLDIPYWAGVLLGLAVVGFYSVAGGFIAVVWSDLVQGLLMLAGLVIIALVALARVGGFEALGAATAAIDPNLLTVFGSAGPGVRGIVAAIGMFAIGWAYLGSPQLFVRFIAIRSVREIPRGALIAVAYTALADCGAVLAGMCGRVLVGSLADKEQVLPELANMLLPTIGIGMLIAVVLAAIMSTADSLLVLASSAIVRDIYQKANLPALFARLRGVPEPAPPTQDHLTRMSRIVTVFVCLLALAFALTEARVIFWFVLFAWAGIGSAFCPPIILSLFWKGLTRTGTIAAMVTGFAVTIGFKLLPPWLFGLGGAIATLAPAGKDPDALVAADLIYEMIPAFVGSFAVAIVVSWFTRKPQNAAADLDALRGEVVDLWR